MSSATKPVWERSVTESWPMTAQEPEWSSRSGATRGASRTVHLIWGISSLHIQVLFIFIWIISRVILYFKYHFFPVTLHTVVCVPGISRTNKGTTGPSVETVNNNNNNEINPVWFPLFHCCFPWSLVDAVYEWLSHFPHVQLQQQ